MARVELRNYRRAQSPLHTLFRLFRYFLIQKFPGVPLTKSAGF